MNESKTERDKDPLISDEELRDILARCRKATPGPWRSFVESRDNFSGSDFIRTAGEDIYLIGATSDDQDFIANCRQDVERLIVELLRLRGIVTKLEK